MTKHPIAVLLLAVALGLLSASHSTAASVDWSAYGTAGNNGWYRSDVWINWSITNISPPLMQTCDPVHLTADTTGTSASCTVIDASGATTRTTSAIRIDQTAPSGVSAATGRAPDFNGWFNHPVAVAWAGTDVTSGIVSCTSTTYSGPDSASATVSGSCTDRAGNVSAPVGKTLKYDATAPAITGLAATPGDGAATLSWGLSTDVQRVIVARSPGGGGANTTNVFDGGPISSFTDGGLVNGTRYTYDVRAIDEAANAATVSVNVVPATQPAQQAVLSASQGAPPATIAPSAGAPARRARAALPLVRWRGVSRARYYNFQLTRHGRKLLSAWPVKPHFQVPSTWIYHGRRHRLVPGLYRWYVWAGYGPRSAHRYGRLIAKGAFRIK